MSLVFMEFNYNNYLKKESENMPLPMVHLSVARSIAEMGFELGDLSQFYLAYISPDAIHMRPNSDKRAKRKTHLSPIRLNRFFINKNYYVKYLHDFIKANRNKSDVDFLLGYCVHVLTDVYWLKCVGPKFVINYIKDSSPKQDIRGAYYNDTEILDQVLFNESIWKDNVWQSLQDAKVSGFLNLLTAQEVNLWKERTLHWYDSSDSKDKYPIRYITKSDIENFISVCSERIRDDFSFVTQT